MERNWLEMSENLWCLFCGEDGPKFKTFEILMDHMKTTIHRDEKGGMIIYTGDRDAKD